MRVVNHTLGETEMEEKPERIVTLYQGATDVAVALGVRPVGIVESQTYIHSPPRPYCSRGIDSEPISTTGKISSSKLVKTMV